MTMAAAPDDPPQPPASSNDNNDSGNVGEAEGGSDPSQPQQPQLPIECQLYEVDLTNPDMDPLEYAFRRFVPIPKQYFWDTACEENQYNRNLPLRTKLWHRSIYWGGEALKRAEAVGGVVANFLGLNDGPFEYVTETMTEEDMARSRANVEQRREEQEEMQRRKEGPV